MSHFVTLLRCLLLLLEDGQLHVKCGCSLHATLCAVEIIIGAYLRVQTRYIGTGAGGMGA